jgi:hypothetical protein
MNKSSNVIDLKTRRSVVVRSDAGSLAHETDADGAPVLDMSERRARIVDDERRDVKRTILTEFVGAFMVIPERGLHPATLYDISEDGLAFDLDLGAGAMKVSEEVAMRVYLNHQTYFPFTVRVSNVRILEHEAVIRHGVSFVKGTVNDQALYHFVKFIETVSASLRTDQGDIMVSGLGR